MNDFTRPETPEAKAERKKIQAEDSERAMAEYKAAQADTLARTWKLRAARLAREAREAKAAS